MARPTDQERLEKMDKKIQQMQARKHQLKNRVEQRERKARTHRLIQVGAIFESYIVDTRGINGKKEVLSPEQAKKIAFRSAEYIKENMEDILKTDVEKSMEQGKTVYEIEGEKIIIPDTNAKYNKENEDDI